MSFYSYSLLSQHQLPKVSAFVSEAARWKYPSGRGFKGGRFEPTVAVYSRWLVGSCISLTKAV